MNTDEPNPNTPAVIPPTSQPIPADVLPPEPEEEPGPLMVSCAEETCPRCGKTFRPSALSMWGQLMMKTSRCQPCIEIITVEEAAQREQQERDALAKARLERWRKLCPENYDNTDPERLPASGKAVLPQILGWQFGAKGLVIVGDSGSGKTRMVYLKLKELFGKGLSIRVLTSSGFRSQASAAAKACALEDWVDSLIAVDVVFFDDLGQMTMTESSEEALLSVIEGRVSNGKPIIVTTQYKSDEFTAQFIRQNRGVAVRRRILEFCTPIPIVTPKEKKV